MRCSNSSKPNRCIKGDCPYFTYISADNPERIEFEKRNPDWKYLDDFWEQCDYEKITEDAIAVLEQQDKYRWHDLRKNPYDLPEECDCFPDDDKQVEIVGGNRKHYFACYVRYDNERFGWKIKHQKTYASRIVRPIAWREIVPFEEEE